MDIIVLIFLCRSIYKLAKKKSLNKTAWVVLFLAVWFACVFAGATVGLLAYGEEALVGSIVVGYVLAFGSYFGIKAIMKSYGKEPETIRDVLDDEMARKDLDHFR